MLQGSNQRDLTSLNPEETNECIDFCIASLEEISSKDGITNSHHWIHQMLSALTTLRNAQRSSSDASFLQMYLMQIFTNFRLDRVESYSKQADVQEIDEAAEKVTQATHIVSENCYLTAFCEEFFYRFIQQSTTFLVVSSGAVSTKLGKSAYPIHSVEFVTPAVETISHLLHIPVISAFTKAGTAFLEKGVMKLALWGYEKHHHKSDNRHAKRLLAVSSKETIERLALRLAMIYRNQICQLTENGARQLAAYAFELICNALLKNQITSAKGLLWSQSISSDVEESFLQECFYSLALLERPTRRLPRPKKMLEAQEGSALKKCTADDIFRHTDLLVRSPMGNDQYFDLSVWRNGNKNKSNRRYGHRILPAEYLSMFPREVLSAVSYAAKGYAENQLLEDDFKPKNTRRIHMYSDHQFEQDSFVSAPVSHISQVPLKYAKGVAKKPNNLSEKKEPLDSVPSRYSRQWSYLRSAGAHYIDDEMHFLFEAYAEIYGDSEIQLFKPIAVRDPEQRKALKEKLIQFHEKRSHESGDNQKVFNQILVPLNWGNAHWVLVEVKYLDEGKVTHISYFDPRWKDLSLPMARPTSVPLEVQNIFNGDRLFPRSTVCPITWNGVPETNDADVLLVEIARRLFKGTSIQDAGPTHEKN